MASFTLHIISNVYTRIHKVWVNRVNNHIPDIIALRVGKHRFTLTLDRLWREANWLFFFSSVSLYMNLITFTPRGRLEFQLVSHNYYSWCSRTTRNNNSFCRQLLIDLLVAYISILMPFLKPTLQWLSRVYLMNEY